MDENLLYTSERRYFYPDLFNVKTCCLERKQIIMCWNICMRKVIIKPSVTVEVI